MTTSVISADTTPGAATAARGSIELRQVRKTYGDVVAVDELDLVVQPGEFVTLLGPSGSGKTTTMQEATVQAALLHIFQSFHIPHPLHRVRHLQLHQAAVEDVLLQPAGCIQGQQFPFGEKGDPGAALRFVHDIGALSVEEQLSLIELEPVDVNNRGFRVL